MCVRQEASAAMIQRNMDRNDDNALDELTVKNEELHKAASVDQDVAEIAVPHAGDDAHSSDDVVGVTIENKLDDGLVAPHKKLNTIRTKMEEEDEEDANNLLSDEEIAWKLHQELNAGSPVLRTRSQRGGSKPRSNLAESSLRSAASGEKKKQGDDASHSGDKRRRGSHLGVDQDKRKSPRAHASSEQPSVMAEDKGTQKGPVKARSRKGKPQIAAEGIEEHNNNNNNPSRAKKHTSGRRKTTKVLPKIPKLPMVRQGNHWYRARVLKEDEHRILVEFAGYEHSLPSTWLPKYCQRVWLGSYKGKDWRYQGEGAWVPKNGIQNRIINAQEYGIDNVFVEDDEAGINTDDTVITGRKTPVVGTPNLIPDVAIVNPLNGPHKRKRKSNLSDRETSQRSNRRGRGRKRTNSEDNDSKTMRQNSSKSGDDASREESETGRRDRPRRHTKPTAILNSDDFAVDAEVDMMDSELQNGYTDTTFGYVPHSKPPKGAWNGDARRRNMYYQDSPSSLLNSRDEQEALAALTEMPSSPASWQGMMHSEAMLENSREALLEAYANGKSSSYDEKISAKNPRRRSYKSEPDLHRSHTAKSISAAGHMFGDILHAISSRVGNGIQRSMSMPSATPSGLRNSGWSPHVWSSGVHPANSEPTIVQVPNSLIQKALLSPKHVDAATKTPPVPLFY